MTSIRESREMVRKRRPSVLIHKQHNDGSSSFGVGQQVEGWRDGKQHLGLKVVVCLLVSNRTARVTFFQSFRNDPSETTYPLALRGLFGRVRAALTARIFGRWECNVSSFMCV